MIVKTPILKRIIVVMKIITIILWLKNDSDCILYEKVL